MVEFQNDIIMVNVSSNKNLVQWHLTKIVWVYTYRIKPRLLGFYNNDIDRFMLKEECFDDINGCEPCSKMRPSRRLLVREYGTRRPTVAYWGWSVALRVDPVFPGFDRVIEEIGE